MSRSLLKDCVALVIDPSPTSRSVLAAQMREFGVGTIQQCGRLIEAGRLLDARTYDIVLCEMDFHADGGSIHSGREFLEDLRQSQRLPLSTVFIMVTGERAYAKVAEAAESALDSYLLKPFTAAELSTRLVQSRQRKLALKDIFAAIDRGDFEAAARECVRSFHARGRYWLYAARLGAELLLNLKLHVAAQELLDAVVNTQALPWARLGLARVQLETHQKARAMCTLETLILDEPAFADAYDVMGRAQVAQGAFDEALETYRNATDLTPGSVRRQQTLGMLAFFCGDHATAKRALDRACVLGKNSRAFDHQALVLMAATHFREKDSRGLQRCKTDLAQALEDQRGGTRLRRMLAIIGVFDLMLQRQVARVVAELKGIVSEIRQSDFDVEAACNVLMVVAQLTAAELNLPDADDWVDAVAMRFCGAKAISETLALAASGHPPYAERVRDCHGQVQGAVQAAMTHSIKGNPGAALRVLLTQADKTLNARFIDTAVGVLQRYGESMADAAALDAELQAVRERAGHGLAVAAPVAVVPGTGRVRAAMPTAKAA